MMKLHIFPLIIMIFGLGITLGSIYHWYFVIYILSKLFFVAEYGLVGLPDFRTRRKKR